MIIQIDLANIGAQRFRLPVTLREGLEMQFRQDADRHISANHDGNTVAFRMEPRCLHDAVPFDDGVST